jgi:hypothetical protein
MTKRFGQLQAEERVAMAAFTAKLNQIAQPMRQSLTDDQGREMSKHQDRFKTVVPPRTETDAWRLLPCEHTVVLALRSKKCSIRRIFPGGSVHCG